MSVFETICLPWLHERVEYGDDLDNVSSGHSHSEQEDFKTRKGKGIGIKPDSGNDRKAAPELRYILTAMKCGYWQHGCYESSQQPSMAQTLILYVLTVKEQRLSHLQ